MALWQSQATQLLKRPRGQFCMTWEADICEDPSRPLCFQCYGHKGLEAVQQCEKGLENKQITHKMSHMLYSTDHVTKHALMSSISSRDNPRTIWQHKLIAIVSYAKPAWCLKPTGNVTKTSTKQLQWRWLLVIIAVTVDVVVVVDSRVAERFWTNLVKVRNVFKVTLVLGVRYEVHVGFRLQWNQPCCCSDDCECSAHVKVYMQS